MLEKKVTFFNGHMWYFASAYPPRFFDQHWHIYLPKCGIMSLESAFKQKSKICHLQDIYITLTSRKIILIMSSHLLSNNVDKHLYVCMNIENNKNEKSSHFNKYYYTGTYYS